MKRLVVLALLGLATSAAGFAQMRGMRMSAPSRSMARPPMAFAHPRFGGIRPTVSPRPMNFAPRPGFRVRPGFAGRRPIFLARPASPLRTSSFGRRIIVMPHPNHGRVASVRPRLPVRGHRTFFRGHHHRPDFDFDEDDEDFDGDFDDRFFFTSPFLFGSFPFYSPFYNPFFGDAFFSDYSNTYSNPQPSSYDSEVANSSINQLSGELRDLSSEVDLLREQDDLLHSDLQRSEAREPQASSGNVSPTPSEPPVVLIFRDGHRSEVQNYAIVGQTFWILSDKKSIKVPLSELDLDQTTKANRDRGLTFSIGPGPR